MKKLSLTALAAVNLLCLMPACVVDSGDTEDDTGVGPTNPQTDPGDTTSQLPTTSTSPGDTTAGEEESTAGEEESTAGEETSSTDTETGGGDGPICAHLGGIDGIAELVTNFLGVVLTDDRINAYFLSNTIDFTALGTCVVTQLGEATGCEGVTYSCKTMVAAHAGLGISTLDFMDFAEDFTTAWDAHAGTHPDVTVEDYDAVLTVLGSMAPDIVEDADNNVTVYQRVGRKPAIKGLIGDPGAPDSFVGVVAANAAINGFFGASDFMRLNTCLTRQVHSIDGPNTYGLERDGLPPGVDPGASQAAPCRDMMSSHADLVDANDNMGISIDDFLELVDNLVTAMNTAGVPMADQNLILGALGPLCPMIVTVQPADCG